MARMSELLAAGRTFSFEFFPPKTDSRAADARPHHRRARTARPELRVGHLRRRREQPPAHARRRRLGAHARRHHADGPPHLPGPQPRRDRRASSTTTTSAGIENILALGGDPPADPADARPSDYAYALDLVDDVAARPVLASASPPTPSCTRAPPTGPPTGATSPPSCAAPTSPSPSSSSRPSTTCGWSTSWPSSASTSRCCPGIMPVTNVGQVARMATMSGAEVPAWLVERLDSVDDPAEVRRDRRRRWRPSCAPQLLDGGGARACTSTPSTAARRRGRSTPTSVCARWPSRDGDRRAVAMPVPPPAAPTSADDEAARVAAAEAADQRVPYLPGLDGMRALAVVAVMVYHANSVVAAGRVPRRRGVLRDQRLPDHAAADRRARADGRGQARRSSGCAGPAACCRRCSSLLVGVTVYTRCSVATRSGKLRGDVVAALSYVSNWYQIWVGQGYTRVGRLRPAAPPVEPRRRGAVLPRVAAGDGRPDAPRSPSPAASSACGCSWPPSASPC